MYRMVGWAGGSQCHPPAGSRSRSRAAHVAQAGRCRVCRSDMQGLCEITYLQVLPGDSEGLGQGGHGPHSWLGAGC